MDMFLVKYLVCSVGIPSILKADSRVQGFQVAATAAPGHPGNFWIGVTASDRESYDQFAEEVVRIEATTKQGINVFYLCFRTARDNRPDIGPNRYTLSRPSSIELGYCPQSTRGFRRLYKQHYIDYNAADERALTKAILKDLAIQLKNNIK